MSLIGTHVVDYKVQGYQAGILKNLQQKAQRKMGSLCILSSGLHIRLSN